MYIAIETRNYQGFKNKKTDKKNGDNPSFLRDQNEYIAFTKYKSKTYKTS